MEVCIYTSFLNPYNFIPSLIPLLFCRSKRHTANIRSTDIPVLAGYAGCHLVREVARDAYAKHGRAVLTSDMVGEIGGAFSRVFGESE